MRRTTVVATALALSLTGASAASAADGTGSVTDTVSATAVSGLLTIAGTGANVSLSGTPGTWTDAVGATVITVSDLTGGDAGWAVTATYSAPAAGTAGLGGTNVRVSATNVTGDLTSTVISPVTDAALTSPVTVASTGAAAGTGVTAFTAKYKVLLPATAQVGDVFGGQVTYTVATVR